MNTLRTGILMAAMTGLFLAVGYLLGGGGGMLIALIVAVAMNAFAYWNADKMVLRLYRARPVGRAEAPALYGIVEQLADNAGLPMPRVYIIDDEQPNAFATGRNPEHAVVCVTQGIMSSLTRDQLEGVIAHELAHIKNRDTLISTVAATIIKKARM